MAKYLVETVSMFRVRYVVECESAEHAKDTISMAEAPEFGQKHIDESIVSCRAVDDKEIVELFIEDHPYLVDWVPNKAMEYVYKAPYYD